MVDNRRHLSRGDNNDVILTDITRRGQKITRIFKVYDQKDRQSGERPEQKLNWQSVIRQVRTVLAGDLNAHSSLWDLTFSLLGKSDQREWTVIGNDARVTHFGTREDNDAGSAIDFTLVN